MSLSGTDQLRDLVRPGSRPAGRVGIAVLLVVLYAAATTVRWSRQVTAHASTSAEVDVTTYERRFDQLRRALPARGVVGYVGSPDLALAAPGHRTGVAHLHFLRFLLTQYSLAPLLVIESTEPEFVVGNFEPGAVPAAPPGLRLIRDYGNGVVLFRRASG